MATGLKDRLYTYPAFARAGRRIRDNVVRRKDAQIVAGFPMFVPYSAGRLCELASLAVAGVARTFEMTDVLVAATGNGVAEVDVGHFGGNRANTERLKQLLDLYGSDKCVDHDYHVLYGALLSPEANRVLEIGIGTNNLDVVSHMGPAGRPGASLRAFRDFLSSGTVYGADIDRRILFEEDRIETYFVDQTDRFSFEALANQIPDDFDLIIDDGLHSPDANLATLLFGSTKVRVGGYIVIEDISPAAAPLWRLVAPLLKDSFTCWLVSAKGALMFVARRIS